MCKIYVKTVVKSKGLRKNHSPCETSHKEVSQFYSPKASDIASQLYYAFA